MKPTYLPLCLMLASFGAVAAGRPQPTRGNEHANGGDAVAQDFTTRGFQAIAALRARQPLPVTIPLDRLEAAVRTTRVISKETVTLPDANGRTVERDAINQASPAQITVNRRRWLAPTLTAVAKTKLALHEYLGVIGVERNTYEVSSVLAEFLEGRPARTVSTPNNGFVELSTLPSIVTDTAIQMTNAEIELTPLFDFPWFPNEEYLCFKNGRMVANCDDLGFDQYEFCKLQWSPSRRTDLVQNVPTFLVVNPESVGKRSISWSPKYLGSIDGDLPISQLHCGQNQDWTPPTLNQIARILGANFKVRARIQRDVVASMPPPANRTFTPVTDLAPTVSERRVSFVNPTIQIEFLRDFTAYASNAETRRDATTCFVDGERKNCDAVTSGLFCQLSLSPNANMRVWKAGDRLTYLMNRQALGHDRVDNQVILDLFVSNQSSPMLSIGCGEYFAADRLYPLSLGDIQKMFGDYVRVRADIPAPPAP